MQRRQLFNVALCATIAQATSLTSTKAYRSGKWDKPPAPEPTPEPAPVAKAAPAVVGEDPYSYITNWEETGHQC